MAADLIKLKNSNPLYKYPTDAEKLNYNFQQLLNGSGNTSIQEIIEATGQVYLASATDQLFKAITQLIGTAFMFKSVEQEPTTSYTLVPYYNGYAEPATVVPGMRVTFTPSVTNTGTPKVRFSTMLDTYTYPVLKDNQEIQPNVLYPGVLYDMVFVKGDSALGTEDHWNITSSSAANGESDTALMDTLLTQVRNLVTAAGIAYTSTDYTSLTRAVSQFIGNAFYDNAYIASENAYQLTAFGSIPPISSYTNGTMLAFLPSATNIATDPRIRVGELENVIVYNLDGSSLAPGTLNTKSIALVRYLDGQFLLINTAQSQLSLTSGVTVNNISNDASLAGNSESTLLTEQAIKTYVDLKVQSSQENVLLGGKIDSEGNADALHQFNTHCFEIITDTEPNGNYSYSNVTPAEPSKVDVSEGSDTAINAVANVQNVEPDTDTENPRCSTLYWSCTKPVVTGAPAGGFAIDGCKRVYDVTGNRVERVVNDGVNPIGTPYVLESGYTPSYYQVTLKESTTVGNASEFYPGLLKLKHTREDTTPAEIKLQTSLNGTDWYDVVDESSEFDDSHTVIRYRWTAVETGLYYYTESATPQRYSESLDPDEYTLYTDPYLINDSGYVVTDYIDVSASNYKFTASDGTNTITCGSCTAETVVDPIFNISYDYGNLADIELDEDNYKKITVPFALWNRIENENAQVYKNSDLVTLLEGANQLHMRVVATYFPHQEYTPEQAAAGYDVFQGSLTDPETSVTTYTDRTTWEIANIKFFKKISKVPAFSMAYPSKNLEILNKQLTYSAYQQKYVQTSPDVYEALNEVELLDLGATTTLVLYKEYMSEVVVGVPENLVYVQSYAPTANALNEGALWFNLGVSIDKVHICKEIGSDTGIYDWEPTDCILLGKVTLNRVTSGATFEDAILSDLISYRYGNEYTVHSPITGLTSQSETIHHNFGFDVTTDCYLKCIVPELGYAHGDYVALSPGRFENSTLTPSTSTVIIDGTSYTFLTSATTIDNEVSYFDVVDNSTDVLVRYSNLQVLNKTTNTYQPITADHWDLCVFINKD